VSLSEILYKKKSRSVAITFDDGYEDVYTNAMPIMKELGVTGTVFVIGNREKINRGQVNNDLRLMSDSQIMDLCKLGWEIGYHTNTHCDLRTLSKEEKEEEISKDAIEHKLGLNIKYFAYPRGIYNKQISKLIKLSGYSHAFTVEGDYANFSSKMNISRVPVEGKISTKELITSITPLGIIATKFLLKLLVIKEKFL
jgi:peptidoglycan/xylan/chitin deacetylase (PgdA/CDA1 family)